MAELKTTEPVPTVKVTFPSRTLRERFKAVCALNGKNMNEVLIDLVKQYIEENQRNERPENESDASG
ncbi:plasmid partition protein ParG [Microcoleus sp. ARI1-B5]|uniref:plasmid partition protein ParG n=1 Tax=unclassified Microcoleus TaxID=2642155 RepID=UPI002FD3DE4A